MFFPEFSVKSRGPCRPTTYVMIPDKLCNIGLTMRFPTPPSARRTQSRNKSAVVVYRRGTRGTSHRLNNAAWPTPLWPAMTKLFIRLGYWAARQEAIEQLLAWCVQQPNLVRGSKRELPCTLCGLPGRALTRVRAWVAFPGRRTAQRPARRALGTLKGFPGFGPPTPAFSGRCAKMGSWTNSEIHLTMGSTHFSVFFS